MRQVVHKPLYLEDTRGEIKESDLSFIICVRVVFEIVLMVVCG